MALLPPDPVKYLENQVEIGTSVTKVEPKVGGGNRGAYHNAKQMAISIKKVIFRL